MVSKIFLDVDGVLADFRGQCERYNCIEGTKVDWNVIHSAGPKFWEEIDWTAEGKQVLDYLKKITTELEIELYILTAVRAQDGKVGRMNWLRKNVGFDKHHLLIVNGGKEKTYYAEPDALLIDDYEKNCALFNEAGGQVIQFKSFDQMKNKLEDMI